MARRYIKQLILIIALLLAAVTVTYEVVAPWGKEDKRIFAGQNLTGKDSWSLDFAARGASFRRYAYFPKSVMMSPDAERTKWEAVLYDDNPVYERHVLWSVATHIPVFAKDRVAYTLDSRWDSYIETARSTTFLAG